MSTVTLTQIIQAHADTLERTTSKTSTGEEISAEDLYELFTVEPPKCEADHKFTSCSVAQTGVTHRVRYCKGSGLVCWNAAQLIQKKISGNLAICGGCKRGCQECWTLNPA